MLWHEQFEIIKEKAWAILSKKKIAPSLAQLDELLMITRGKSRAWANGQRPSADDLENIARVLGFSSRWLLLGEGEPEHHVEQIGGADFSVESAKGKLPGDYLWQARRELGLSEVEMAEALGISLDELQDYLASRRQIPWNVLISLVSKLGISLNCVLADIEPLLLSQQSIVGRMVMATGASLDELAWIFGVPLEQLKALATPGGEVDMPYKWVQRIALEYGIKPGWLREGTYPILMSESEREKYREIARVNPAKNAVNGD